jgi:hypothetical protein
MKVNVMQQLGERGVTYLELGGTPPSGCREPTPGATTWIFLRCTGTSAAVPTGKEEPDVLMETDRTGHPLLGGLVHMHLEWMRPSIPAVFPTGSDEHSHGVILTQPN